MGDSLKPRKVESGAIRRWFGLSFTLLYRHWPGCLAFAVTATAIGISLRTCPMVQFATVTALLFLATVYVSELDYHNSSIKAAACLPGTAIAASVLAARISAAPFIILLLIISGMSVAGIDPGLLMMPLYKPLSAQMLTYDSGLLAFTNEATWSFFPVTMMIPMLLLAGLNRNGHGFILSVLWGASPRKAVLFEQIGVSQNVLALYGGLWLISFPSLFAAAIDLAGITLCLSTVLIPAFFWVSFKDIFLHQDGLREHEKATVPVGTIKTESV